LVHRYNTPPVCHIAPHLSGAPPPKLSDCQCLPGRGVPHSALGFPARASASSWVRTSQSRPPKRTQAVRRPAAASVTVSTLLSRGARLPVWGGRITCTASNIASGQAVSSSAPEVPSLTSVAGYVSAPSCLPLRGRRLTSIVEASSTRS